MVFSFFVHSCTRGSLDILYSIIENKINELRFVWMVLVEPDFLIKLNIFLIIIIFNSD